MRSQLLRCCNLDWSRISPAVFGSLFQSVMEPKERRQVGAHYTSERDILKLINSLFLDELKEEFEKIKHDPRKLKTFHEKLGKLRFLDPACGCGNFLVVTYRELRLLEIEVLKLLLKNQQVTDVGLFSLVDVDSMHGIEINEFPALIAEVAMWLIDHQMNLMLSEEFGQYFIRLPLKKSAKIVNANALRIDWADVIKSEVCSYVLGNPPFRGSAYQDDDQKADLLFCLGEIQNAKMLDYVSAWYVKAMKYMKETQIKCGFVSTNSITQGEQVGILWGWMLNAGAKIFFAHRTFPWSSEAKGAAVVHCVIIGFACTDISPKRIFDYQGGKHAAAYEAKTINAYLIDAPSVTVDSRKLPISNAPLMQSGSAARDGGFLILTDQEASDLKLSDERIKPFLKRFISGDDFINGVIRWCIWLKDTPPESYRHINAFHDRFQKVKEFRSQSSRLGTKRMATLPYLFAEERQPKHDFLLIPKVTSENRKYVPIAYLSKDFVVSDKTFVIVNASTYAFGTVTSLMHMAWMRTVCGRLKSDYSYSNTIVYNNFPWPQNPTDKQKANVEAKAQAVLDARAKYPDSSLADLYDPLTMPPELVKAHEQLDRAVEQCYRAKPFESDRERVEYLFQLYEQLTAPLTAQVDKPKRTRKKKTEE